MKKIAILFYILVAPFFISAQSDTIRLQVYRLRISDEFLTTMKIGVDTSFNNFQTVNTVTNRSISNLFLGNIGLPVRSNIYRFIENNDPFIFSRSFEQYRYTPSDLTFYDANKPFTNLQLYTTPKRLEENNIGILHTRNFGAKWNFTLLGRYIISTGEYSNQKAKTGTALVNLSYVGNHYKFIIYTTRNKFDIEENGGIVDNYDPNDSQIPVQLENVFNMVKNYTYGIKHAYYIEGEKNEIIKSGDSISEQRVKYPMLSFSNSISLTQNTRIYSDEDPNNGITNRALWFYDRYYLDSLNSYDSVAHKIFSANVGVKMNDKTFNFLKTGFSFNAEFAKNEIYNFKEMLILDNNSEFNNFAIQAAAFNESWQYFNWKYAYKLGLNGYNKGDLENNLRVETKVPFGKKDTLFLNLNAFAKLETPSFWESNFYGNRVKWENNLEKVAKRGIELTLRYPKYRQNLSIGIENIEGYTYFGSDLNIHQTNDPIQVLYLGYNTTIHLGILRNRLRIEYQNFNNSLLHLPNLAIYNSTYLNFVAIKKVLTLQLGADVYYTSEFKPLNYNPAGMIFYNQNEFVTGNRPIVDVFVNGRIRRARIFVKYTNLTSIFTQNKVFYLPNYPVESARLKFGVSWLFYD